MSLGLVALKAGIGAGAKAGLMAAYGLDATKAIGFGLQGLVFSIGATVFPPFALVLQAIEKFSKAPTTYSVEQRDNLAVLGLGGAAQYFLKSECNNQGIPVHLAARVIRSHARKEAWVSRRGIDPDRIYIDDAGRFEFLDVWPDRHTPLERHLQGTLGLSTAPVIGSGDPLERELAQDYFGYRVVFNSMRPEQVLGYVGVCRRLGIQPEFTGVHQVDSAIRRHLQWGPGMYNPPLTIIPVGVDIVLDGQWHLQSRIGAIAEEAGDKDEGILRERLGSVIAEAHVAFADQVVVELGPLEPVRRRQWQETGKVVIQSVTYFKSWTAPGESRDLAQDHSGSWFFWIGSFVSSVITRIGDFLRSLFNGR